MMNITSTFLSGVVIAEGNAIADERGAFERIYCTHELSSLIDNRQIVQINHSVTKKSGVVRGFHFQYPPYAEMKLIRCMSGRVWDVILDLRKKSSTYLQWHAEELSAEDSKMIIIPEGCAHAFQTLDDNSELLYLHTDFYTPKNEGGVNVLDPVLAINWPLPVQNLSNRDKSLSFIDNEFTGVVL